MPRERLAYHDGQRLDAEDLQTEQDYHTGLRRLLNQGLFMPGVVTGLEVTAAEAADGTPLTRAVHLATGFALDDLGRAVVAEATADVAVPAQPPPNGTDFYYLVLRYVEERIRDAAADEPPGRVREGSRPEWTEVIPDPRQAAGDETSVEHAIVLALVRLTGTGEVAEIDPSARRFAFPKHVSRVQAVAYEGEQDIAEGDSKKLYFHIRGGSPSAVTLYLRGDRFSPSRYAELGSHSHGASVVVPGHDIALPQHQHNVAQHTHAITETDETDPGKSNRGIHRHDIRTQILTRNNHPERAIATFPGASVDLVNQGYRRNRADDFDDGGPFTDHPYIGVSGTHRHLLTNGLDGPISTGAIAPAVPATPYPHQPVVTVDRIGSIGPVVRGGEALTFPTDVRVELNGADITGAMLLTLGSAWPDQRLGGGELHPFNKEGTGAVDLMRIGSGLGPGEHLLEFFHGPPVQGGPPAGGKVIYQLYVE